MTTTNGYANGHVSGSPPSHEPLAEAPEVIRDLCDACVRYVKKAVGVDLDYTLETLPILDHYLRGARDSSPAEHTPGKRPPVMALIAHAAGAYLGEVVRRRHASWWRVEGDDPAGFRVELEAVYLSFSPVELVADVLFPRAAAVEHTILQEVGTDEGERLELDEDDRAAVGARLAELPPVDEDEFFAPSTRVEVIDIAVEAIRARRLATGEGESRLRPEDYTSE